MSDLFHKSGTIFLVCCSLFLVSCDDKSKKAAAAKYDPQLKATVTDLTPPEILCDKSYKIKKGADFDLKKKIKVSDNMDTSPKIEITGKLDVKNTGTYVLQISAKDKTGNVSNKEVTVIVEDTAKKPDIEKEKPAKPDNDITEQLKPQLQPSNPIHENAVNAQPKFFSFTEGIPAEQTYSACMSYGAGVISEGKANQVTCNVVDDANGIHTGYQAIFN